MRSPYLKDVGKDVGKNLLLSSFRLSPEFSSLCLEEGDSYFSAGCQPEADVRVQQGLDFSIFGMAKTWRTLLRLEFHCLLLWLKKDAFLLLNFFSDHT